MEISVLLMDAQQDRLQIKSVMCFSCFSWLQMSDQAQQHRADEILWWRLQAPTLVEVEVKETLRQLLLHGAKVDQTLKLTVADELETVWAKLMSDKNRILRIKPVFLELWRRVEGRLEKANA